LTIETTPAQAKALFRTALKPGTNGVELAGSYQVLLKTN
jgi:hypothetical protein